MTSLARDRLDCLMGLFSNDILSVLRTYREGIEFAAREVFDAEPEFASFAACSFASAIIMHLMTDHGFCEHHAAEVASAVTKAASENCAPAGIAPQHYREAVRT